MRSPLRLISTTPPLEASSDTLLFQTIVEVMQKREPDVPVLPYLMPAGTDAKHIVPRRPETQIYGFMPYRQQLGEEEMALIHGHDERTPVKELLFATQVLYGNRLSLWRSGEPLARIDDHDSRGGSRTAPTRTSLARIDDRNAIVDFEDQNLIAGVERALGVGPARQQFDGAALDGSGNFAGAATGDGNGDFGFKAD